MSSGSVNNFRKLIEEEEAKNAQTAKDLRHNVSSSIGVFRFFGDIVELYIPRLFSMMVNMLGGQETPPDQRRGGSDPSGLRGAGPNRRGPSGAEDQIRRL